MLIAAVAALLAGCNPEETPSLSVDQNSFSFTSSGGTNAFHITSNTAWSVSSDAAGWLELGQTSGEGGATVTLKVIPFTEAIARSATVTVTGATGLIQTIAVVQTPPAPPAQTDKQTVAVIAAGGEQTIAVPSGYTIQASSDQSWLKVVSAQDGQVKISAEANGSDEYRDAKITVVLTDGTVLSEIAVKQSWRNVEPGELLIEEVYFSGSPIEGSNYSSDDQYIKLTNNSDHVVYADRVMFVMSWITGTKTSAGAYYEYPELEDGLAVSDMYVIPGSGTEHPIEPGKSIVLAIHAQDFKAENPKAIDLSKADFEFFDGTDHSYPDTDNPDVTNLDIWFKSSFTITQLHGRGLESYAIVTPPASETAESLMANRHWSGQRIMYFNEFVFKQKIENYDVWVIPGEWVIDAVNCSLADLFYFNPWPDAFDSGWTFCGEFDGDQSRYGKSVLRKKADGKLVDTNNSTNDFTPNATPSLSE